jgi:hypothetical protein
VRTDGLQVDVSYRRGVTTTRPGGTLDPATYPQLRDTLLKYTAEQPDGLLIELDGLTMPSTAATSVFPLVASRAADWPGIPVLLVLADEARRARLMAGMRGRFVPVHDSVPAAIASIDPPVRSRAVIELPPSPVSTRRARYFVRMNCARWGLNDLTTDAMTVVTAFVENTLTHTGSTAFLRVELLRGVLTVAVTDDDPCPAVLRERAEGGVAPSGLLLVSAVARLWGCTPTMDGGKTVWAVLRRAGRGGSEVGLH